ncbi:MAG: hypothetical protein ACI9M3_001409 [Bacteroidia bacterium]|jgi:hypothetical protein
MIRAFFDYGFVTPVIFYLIYDIALMTSDPLYDYITSIRVFGLMLFLTLILTAVILVWIPNEVLKYRIHKSFKISLFWSYLVLVISEGFLYMLISIL